MHRRISTYRWLLTVWLMLLGCLCPVSAYDYTPQYTNPYASPSASSFGSTAPTYQFRSTSAYTPSMGTTATFTPLADNPGASPATRPGLRKGGNPWDEDPGEDDEPIGQKPDPQPIGDVAWGAIFLCAALYLAVRIYRRKVE